MNSEELNRSINFILDQQARLVVADEKLRLAQERHVEERNAADQRLAEKLFETNEVVTRLARVTAVGFKDVNDKIDTLINTQIRTDEQLRQTDEQLKQTNEQLKQTNEQLRQTDAQVGRTELLMADLIESQKRTDARFADLLNQKTPHDQKS